MCSVCNLYMVWDVWETQYYYFDSELAFVCVRSFRSDFFL